MRTSIGYLILVLAIGACVPGPFERRNPYDPGSSVTMRLEVVTDTVSVLGEIAELRLVLEPEYDTARFPPAWFNARSDLLMHLGHGRFEVIALPPSPTAVTIRARYPGVEASAVIVVGRP